jgi:hypothetical protein
MAATLVVAAIVASGACSSGDPGPADAGRASAPGSALTARISQLAIGPERSSSGYSRSQFGEGWADADGDGCRTRCEVLERDRRATLPGLAGGGWLSAYDGYTTDDPTELDIDHVVALDEAWRSGASAWTRQRRVAFANNLDDPVALTAVTAASNRSKGAKDPARWQPSNRDDWCGYVSAWVGVKLAWGLGADPAEERALTNMSRGCPDPSRGSVGA